MTCRDERGAATVFAVSLVAVLVLVALGCGVAVGAVAAQRRAQAAADLGALAGAQALQRGDDACAAAARTSGRNGAQLRGCTIEGFDVLVRVEAVAVPGLGDGLTLPARARAGPAAR